MSSLILFLDGIIWLKSHSSVPDLLLTGMYTSKAGCPGPWFCRFLIAGHLIPASTVQSNLPIKSVHSWMLVISHILSHQKTSAERTDDCFIVLFRETACSFVLLLAKSCQQIQSRVHSFRMRNELF